MGIRTRSAEEILTSPPEQRDAARVELDSIFLKLDDKYGEHLYGEQGKDVRGINLKGKKDFDVTLPIGAIVQRDGGFQMVNREYVVRVRSIDYDHVQAYLPDGSYILFPTFYLANTQDPEILREIARNRGELDRTVNEILRSSKN